jgi:hypothetical protein
MSGRQLLVVAVMAGSALTLVLPAQAAATVAPSEPGSAMDLLTLVFMVGGAVGSATAGSLSPARGQRRPPSGCGAAAGRRGRCRRRRDDVAAGM